MDELKSDTPERTEQSATTKEWLFCSIFFGFPHLIMLAGWLHYGRTHRFEEGIGIIVYAIPAYLFYFVNSILGLAMAKTFAHRVREKVIFWTAYALCGPGPILLLAGIIISEL